MKKKSKGQRLSKSLGDIIDWQERHAKEDSQRFGSIEKTLKSQPTKQETLSIADTLSKKTDEVAVTLSKKTDEAFAELAKKTEDNAMTSKAEGLKIIETLATKEDIKEVLKVFNNIKIAGEVISGGGRWGYRIVLALASLVAAWAVIMGGWKIIIAWLTLK